ncbi:putative cyclase-domain-containing protein [Dactylonectria macrodidyma]|uniref:Cyclase-domain-containing protein n=1 Tax=Dactylonectria macrodidyma TaxID=307937 RepID=A0A9P9J1F0_9HYPO|nr:putative cyclase-domain-containing protein [Dactylonectria macrodidyma]
MQYQKLPNYDEIPSVKDMPHGCAWGLWDKEGEVDQVGSLNLLTPANVVKAKEEIQSGVSVSLNWPLERIEDPGHNRNKIVHRFLDLKPNLIGHDDEICINTQTSSQWDGLRHWAHQESGKYYNGLTHEEISGSNRNLRNEWLKRGGVIGRGVLLDYASWAKKRGVTYSAASKHCISHEDLENIAKEEGVELRVGDILMVRTGWIQWYNESSPEQRVDGCKTHHNYVGVEGTAESIRWLWDHHFSALVGDNMAFEAWPAPAGPYRIHDTALALWGTPLGELWDLEELAEQCKRHNRWSFFVTSCPLNVSGGVASPPNALAIF